LRDFIISRRGRDEETERAVVAAIEAGSQVNRKTRILKGFRSADSTRKSFLDRPLLLAMMYPMNIELGNRSLSVR